MLVHPPGGLVGGDVLDIQVGVDSGAHGLVTTPGATRFYRSQGETAVQRSRIVLAPGARMEWLPAEALCYDACQAENHLQMELAPGAELIGWDVTAFGLPHAGLPFLRGSRCSRSPPAATIRAARRHRAGVACAAAPVRRRSGRSATRPAW